MPQWKKQQSTAAARRNGNSLTDAQNTASNYTNWPTPPFFCFPSVSPRNSRPHLNLWFIASDEVMKWMMGVHWGIGWSSIFLGSRRTTVGQCRAIAHWLHASLSSTAIHGGVVRDIADLVLCCQTESFFVGGTFFKRHYIMLDYDYDYGLNISNELWLGLLWLTLSLWVTLLWRCRSLQAD